MASTSFDNRYEPMSQVAPDIPELAHLRDVLRPLVWTRALMRAIHSPATWLFGLTVFVATVAAGGGAGQQVLGRAGAILGGTFGAVAAVYLLLRAFVPWRARRFVPIVEKEIDWTAEFGDVIRAQDTMDRMVRAHNRQQRGDQ